MLSGLVADRVEPEDLELRAGWSARAHDRAEAFRALIDRQLEAAYRVATVILGDQADAEDAVHDAALNAWRHWTELRDHDRADAWFGRIVVNACRDRLRRRKRSQVAELGRAVLDHEHPHAPDTSSAALLRDQLQQAFEQLSADERLVVVLRYEADQTVPAIARLTGAREGTVSRACTTPCASCVAHCLQRAGTQFHRAC